MKTEGSEMKNDITIAGIRFFATRTGSWARNVDGMTVEILGFKPGDGGKRFIVALEGCDRAVVLTHAEMRELVK